MVDESYKSSSRVNPSLVSPYLNFDPSLLYKSEPEFIFPEGANKQRGRFELAFSQIGSSVIAGSALGGLNGLYNGLRETHVEGLKGGVKRTQLLNYVTRQGAGTANILGVVALMYSSFGVLLSWARGTDDEVNTIASGTMTGALFKCTAGPRKIVLGSLVGLGLSATYCAFTSRDKLRSMLKL